MDEPTPPTDPRPSGEGLGLPRGTPWRRIRRIAAIAGVAVAATAAVGVAGVAALWRTEAGTRWLLAHLPGITATDVRGSFGGGRLQVGVLDVDQPSVRVHVENLRLGGLTLRWRPAPGTWLGLGLDDWTADSVRVVPVAARSPAPAKAGPPASLRSPVALEVRRLRVGSLAIGTAPPLRDVAAAVSLGAEDGALHRVENLRFTWEHVAAEGRLSARTDAPFQVDLAVTAHDAPGAAPVTRAASAPGGDGRRALPHWTARATLRGPLAALDLAADLQGDPLPGRAAPQARATAHVTPFAALPVDAVEFTTTELDLRSLSDQAPATRLAGSARLATSKPAALTVALRNLAPAAWSSGGLPFTAIDATLEAPWTGESIAIPSLRIALADEHGAGGALRAQGRWAGNAAQVQVDVDQLQLQRLDTHLGDWRLSGPLRADVTHLPAPASLWGAPPPTRRPGTGTNAASAGASASPASALFADANVHLAGRLAGTAPPLGSGKSMVVPPPMTLEIDATAQADAIALARFDLRAGPASLAAQGALRRGSDHRWQGDLGAQWAQLDPGAWWRLADSGPLRAGPNLLNGTARLELAGAPAAWEGLAAIRGQATLTLAPSRLAGLSLEGGATLDASALPWKVAANLRSGVNQAQAEGTVSPGNASADALAVIEQLHLAVDAPTLGTLAALGPATDGNAPATIAASPANGASAGAAANAASIPAPAKNIPADLLAKAATKVATGGKTDDARALAPALAPSSAAAAPRRTAGASAPAGTARSAATPAGPWPTGGSARFDVRITGGRLAIDDRARRRLPPQPLKIVTQGAVRDLAAAGVRIGSLDWAGQASADPQAPLEATLAVRDARGAGMQLSRLEGTLSGSLAAHRLVLQGEAPVSPPTWLANLANIGNANATRLDAMLQGRWQPGSRTAPAWQGRLEQLDLRAARAPVSAASAVAAGATPASAAVASRQASAAVAAGAIPTVANPSWVHLQPVDLSLTQDAAGQWQTFSVGAGRAEFAGLALTWLPSFYTLPANPSASAHWAFDAALAPFSVAQLLARAQPDLGWHGDLQMNARLHAAFDGRWHVDGQVARTSGDLSVSDLVQDPTSAKQALGLTAALLQVRAEGAAWQADASLAGTRLGELTGHWTAEAPSPASLPQAASPLGGNVRAHVADLNVWGAWLPPGWRLGGELRTDLALSGRWSAPQLTGDLTATQLVIRNALEGFYAHDGDVAIRLTGDQARIERFHLVGGNGDLSLTGNASLGAVPVARLQLTASQFQVLGRIDRKIVASGNASLELGAESLRIAGKIGIDEGLFDLSRGDAPSLDADVEVLDAAAPTPESTLDANGMPPAPTLPEKPGRKTTLALDVDLGQRLHLRGRGIDTFLRGALQITAPNSQLAVRGAIRTDGGQYTAYGQKLNVTRGELTFTGPVADPRLDILATRPNLDVVVGVAITGTAQSPHVRLMSEPEMSDSDKLSWLMLGRAPEGLGSADTALLQQAAIALLAGENEAPTDQLLKRLGLTDFSVGQRADSNEVRQTVVTLGRQISKRWYLGYERSVNATTGSWQLIYRIAQRVTVRAQSGEDNSLDVIWTWRWN